MNNVLVGTHLITTGFLVLLTLLPLVPSNHWIVRVWEFPRLQILFLILLNSIFGVFLLDSVVNMSLLVVNIACFVYQARWVIPYTVLWPKESASSGKDNSNKSIKILTSNVLMPNRSADKLITLIDRHKPDVVVTLETDTWWQEALESLHDVYEYSLAIPQDNLYGMHVYSSLPIKDPAIYYLIQEGIPSISCEIMLDDNTPIKCFFVHPAPPSPTENEYSTSRDKELLLIANVVEPEHIPTIVTGDLNDVAWSPTTRAFRKVSGLQDPRIGRGFFNTFHADYKCLRWPLDHIFHSDHFAVLSIHRLPSIDSDHFPLLSELILKSK